MTGGEALRLTPADIVAIQTYLAREIDRRIGVVAGNIKACRQDLEGLQKLTREGVDGVRAPAHLRRVVDGARAAADEMKEARAELEALHRFALTCYEMSEDNYRAFYKDAMRNQ